MTTDDLYSVEGQAELIDGRIVRMPFHGIQTSEIIMEILVHLYDYAERIGHGEVFTSTLVYVIPRLVSGRESFSPDVSYYVGPFPENPMRFIEGPPTFAVEVRSENDYGPAAERAMADKRADYFEAGTLVVWDVDPRAELIHVYRASDPTHPTAYARGETAEAEPAVSGWRIGVVEIF